MFRLLKKILGAGHAIDYKALISQGAVIVDVRTPGEFNSGHIKGAENIPLDLIKSKAPELKKRNKPVITCCRSGNRSIVAKNILKSSGLECYNGGAWDSLSAKVKG